MSIRKDLRKTVLGVGFATVGLGFIAVRWFWPSGNLSVFATVGLLIALLLLAKQAAKWQAFRRSPTFPIQIPQVSSQWDLNALVKGVVYILASLAWLTCVAFGIKFDVLGMDKFPTIAVLLLLLPFFALLLGGYFLWLARAIFSRN